MNRPFVVGLAVVACAIALFFYLNWFINVSSARSSLVSEIREYSEWAGKVAARECLLVSDKYLSDHAKGQYEERMRGLVHPPVGLLVLPNDSWENFMFDLARELESSAVRERTDAIALTQKQIREIALAETPLERVWEIRDIVSNLRGFYFNLTGDKAPGSWQEVEMARSKFDDLKTRAFKILKNV